MHEKIPIGTLPEDPTTSTTTSTTTPVYPTPAGNQGNSLLTYLQENSYIVACGTLIAAMMGVVFWLWRKGFLASCLSPTERDPGHIQEDKPGMELSERVMPDGDRVH